MFGDARDNELHAKNAKLREILRLQRSQQKKLNQQHAHLRGKLEGRNMGQDPTNGINQVSPWQSEQTQPFPATDSIDRLRNRFQKLPDYMQPSNIGNIFEARWDFRFNIQFDFGANPTWSPATRQTQTFQVDQEACLLLMAVGRSSSAYNDAGELAPLAVVFSDRQSARQFELTPTPIQFYGAKGNPTVFPTPFLLMPNANLDVTVTSIQPNSQTTISSSSKHTFMFYGQRMRVQNAEAVLSTIFG